MPPQMLPPPTTAARFTPSLDMAMPYQLLAAQGLEVFSVQVAPLSLELHILPPLTVAACLTPSLDMAMPNQYLVAPGLEVFSVQVAPLSIELHILPL